MSAGSTPSSVTRTRHGRSPACASGNEAMAVVIRLRGMLGEMAIAQGWTTKQELEQMAGALIAWGEVPDAFYARPAFTAIGWV